MKLLYITNGINGAGGLERVLSIKASYLADRYEYEVTILSLNEEIGNRFYEFSPKINFRSISVKGNPVKYVGLYRNGLQHVVDEIKPDIISVCDDGLKGFFIPRLLKTTAKIIYERHVSKEIEMNHKFPSWKKNFIKAKWRLMEILATYFDQFVVLTNGNKEEWKSLKNLIVIPNPLSFYPDKSSSLQNRKVIAVGKQGYQKGYDRLLKSWQLVQQEAPDWQLEIYGKIEPAFKLKELAHQLNIGKAVHFFPPAKDIERKYLDSSIYVMSSRFEGFGMVLIEAMACGVPCVSFDCNYGPADIIRNNVDGLLVDNDNINSLAEALLKLISEDTIRKEYGKQAKENVKRFLPENIVPRWNKLFNDLIK